MMKVVIAGGGMVGMTFARLLRLRGFEPVVIERMPAGHYVPRGYMLGFQGYEPLEEVGVYDEVRRAGRPIAPRPDQPPVAVAVRFGALIEALERDLPIMNEHTVVELLRDAGRPRRGRRRRGPRRARHHRGGPRGRLRRHALADPRDGGPRGRLRAPARGRPRVHEPLGRRHVVRHGLPVRRRSHRDAVLERGLGRLAQHGPGGRGGGPRTGRRGDQGDVGAAAARVGLGHRGRHLDRADPLLRATAPGLPAVVDARAWSSSATRRTSSAPRPASARASGWGTRTPWPRPSPQNPDDPDAACTSYEMWRAPAVRPYEANDPGRQRIMVAGQVQARPEERWPPPAE